MGAYQDTMTTVLNKIERRLGLIPLTPHLPEEYGKEAWARVIVEDTIPTFSRFYPKKIPFRVTKETAPKKNGWYYIDESYLGSQKILGVGDIDWSAFSRKSIGLAQQFGYGLPDVGMTNFSIGDIQALNIRANYASLFNNNIYPEFMPPNRIRLTAVGNVDVKIGDYTINLLVTHGDDLKSIAPTKMETFEDLAKCDVATFLSNNLKYWDGMVTVFNTLDLKLSNLESEASRRENVIDQLQQSYISAGNDAIPFIMTI